MYKGVHAENGASVALKVLPMSVRHAPAVVNELAAMRRVQHVNVVRLVREEVIEVRRAHAHADLRTSAPA